MTDDQRRSWPNLLLLCRIHHTMVDKTKPEDYPVNVLATWKATREADSSAELNTLTGITEDRLQELISDSTQKVFARVEDAIRRIASVDPDVAEMLSEAAHVLDRRVNTAGEYRRRRNATRRRARTERARLGEYG